MAETPKTAEKKTKKVIKELQSNIWSCVRGRPLARILFAPIYKLYLAASLFIIGMDDIEFYYCTTIILLYMISTLCICSAFFSSTMVRIAQLNIFFTIARPASLQCIKDKFLSRLILV